MGGLGAISEKMESHYIAWRLLKRDALIHIRMLKIKFMVCELDFQHYFDR